MFIKEYDYNTFPKRIIARKTRTKSIPISTLVAAVDKWDEWTMPIFFSYKHTAEYQKIMAEHRARRKKR